MCVQVCFTYLYTHALAHNTLVSCTNNVYSASRMQTIHNEERVTEKYENRKRDELYSIPKLTLDSEISSVLCPTFVFS